MAFIKFVPLGKRVPFDITTTAEPIVQLWQEFSGLRHVIGANSIRGKEVTASWIDQAKIYFLDANKANWKSGGLLYYYSFLNLAKAHIVSKGAVSAKSLKSKSIYHGLAAKPQSPAKIIDFKIEIHPPTQKGSRNIFSLFYEKTTNSKWPFKNTITISIADIVAFCEDITHELNLFHGLGRKNIIVQSVLREHNNNVWFELLVHDSTVVELTANLGNAIHSIINFQNMTVHDKEEWYKIYGRTSSSLVQHSLLRFNLLPITNQNRNAQYALIHSNMTELFKNYIFPLPANDDSTNQFWCFVPKATLLGNQLIWHPLLSNYLFAFVLSTVLRYHPHLFSNGNKNSFMAEAWCNQAPSTFLRYFLMELSNQNIRLNN